MRLCRTLVICVVAVACGASQPPSPTTCTPNPGTVCFGQDKYVEYNVGELPLLISVPHGGATAPAGIPDRTVGITVTDSNTIELGRAIVQAFQARTGRAPHLVLCHLRRTKLDANREVVEAAQGNAQAAQAWTEYHAFLELAAAEVARRHGRGFYIDLHGHGHAIQRLELGYLLSPATLALTDAQINAGRYASQSSLRLLLASTSAQFSALLRGQTSLGGLLEPGVASVPSPAVPAPGDDAYFDGGYSTERHSARLPAVQIESHFTGVRDSAASRAAFASALAAAVSAFVSVHLGLAL